MPMGMGNPVLGYIAFCGVKAVGYTAAAAVISRVYDRRDLSSFAVGLVRTVIGIVVGAAFYAVAHMHFPLSRIEPEYARIIALGMLCLVRIAEWWFLIWLFYARSFADPLRGWKVVIAGIFWSFILDIPSIIGFLVVEGFNVC
jgi:hypothetical protein